ncbi:MAG: hypothetical protein V4637_06550 [Pseudomonadota bacterium]
MKRAGALAVIAGLSMAVLTPDLKVRGVEIDISDAAHHGARFKKSRVAALEGEAQ